ncbi:hypothetical protein BD779DRAFT_1684644 [Infundibulicybe gibba]|nr:hypothetical protein BD779DRAFT_1684644 [Infundibulicybe gibba]
MLNLRRHFDHRRSSQHPLQPPTAPLAVPDMNIFALLPYNPGSASYIIRNRVQRAILYHEHRLGAPQASFSWVIMGGEHKSVDRRPHLTVRGFIEGRGVHTMHVYKKGSKFFNNGGIWEKQLLDLARQGLRL